MDNTTRLTRREFIEGSSSPPNIVFVLSDQQRWDTLGCYGQRLPVTPNLDRMAAEGVLFENAFTTQPVCGPARACIQTGKYPAEMGSFRNDVPPPPDEKTIAHHLRSTGYEVGYIGKWHLAATCTQPVPPELRGGYDDFWLAADALEFTSHGYDGHMWDADMNKVEFKGYRVDCLTDFALEYLRTRDGKRPFFLFISYLEPHHQNDRDRFEGPDGLMEQLADFDVPGDLEGTEGNWKEEMPGYLACCASIDENVGRLRTEIEKLGLADNTLIIYTSDHGCHFKTRNSEYKRSCHDGCIRIPMIAHGPGFAGGKTIDELVSLIDIAPTIMAAGGLEKLPSMHGFPLQDLVSGRVKNWPDEVFLQISESQTGRAVRTKKWKYSVSIPDASKPSSDIYYEDFLYDLESDPHERTNLIREPEYASVRSELADLLKRRMSEAGETIPDIRPAGG